jgi:hypothetical protein
MKSNLPKRSTAYGVGKVIGGNIYVHRAYEHLLPHQDKFKLAKELVPEPFDSLRYNVVKYNLSTGAYSFIFSPNFDSVDEPIVKHVFLMKPSEISYNGFSIDYLKQPNDPWIYHHKWLFVKDDYRGFDVVASKERSERWLSLPDVDKAKIGKKSYWEKYVVPRLTR